MTNKFPTNDNNFQVIIVYNHSNGSFPLIKYDDNPYI